MNDVMCYTVQCAVCKRYLHRVKDVVCSALWAVYGEQYLKCVGWKLYSFEKKVSRNLMEREYRVDCESSDVCDSSDSSEDCDSSDSRKNYDISDSR